MPSKGRRKVKKKVKKEKNSWGKGGKGVALYNGEREK
jgi:hypothetical protein